MLLPPVSLSLRALVCHQRTRSYVRLLGPCFKTGCREPFAKPSHPPEPLPDKSDGFLRNMKRLGCLRSQGGGPREPPKDDQSTHWLPTVPSQQFQALFHSLFKVLFIFPSQYLFAIGLPPVFSLRWNLPPALSYNPKQLDSDTRSTNGGLRETYGIITLYDTKFQKIYSRNPQETRMLQHPKVWHMGCSRFSRPY